MARIAVGPTIAAALSYIGPGWRHAAGALGLLVIVGGLNQYASRLSGRDPGVVLLVAPFVVATSVMVKGALYRFALHPDHPQDPDYRSGLLGLQWRGFEWRVLGATLIVNTIVVVAAIIAILVWAVYLGLVAQAHLLTPIDFGAGGNATARATALLTMLFESPAGAFSLVILTAALAVVAYVAARLNVAPIMVADRGRFDLRAAWALTRGANAAIIVSFIVIYFLALLGALLGGVVGGVLAGIASAVSGAHSGAQWGALLGSVLGVMASSAVTNPAFAGLSSYVYRQRAPRRGVAEVFS